MAAIKTKGQDVRVAEEDETDDPYALPELEDQHEKWRDLNTVQKCRHVAVILLKFLILTLLLYAFICSLDILSSAFRLIGGRTASSALSNSVIMNNPVAGLMIGVLLTVLVQSSSTSTSIIVAMVSAEILQMRQAIPIVMGANIGTTVTNTIVALGQTGDKNQFRRAFAAASVHDMFNWLCVLVLLPVEVITGYLYHASKALTDVMMDSQDVNASVSAPKLLKALTEPLTKKIISVDSGALKDIATGQSNQTESMIKKGDHLFQSTSLTDAEVGGILLVVSLFVLCVCLVLIVKLLHSILKGNIARVIRRFVNANTDGIRGYCTGWLAILIGAAMTFLVQSSSIFTSAMTPLVGIGVIHIDRMYPLTLGSNIGTTATSILAAMASRGDFYGSLRLAFCHLFFNITGVFLFYGIYPLRKLPINAAKYLGHVVAEYRWFAMLYLVLMFFLLPAAVFGISLLGWEVLLGVGLVCAIIIITVIVLNILQRKKPKSLPQRMRTWDFLPKAMHSLEPYDSFFVNMRKKLKHVIKSVRKNSKTDINEVKMTEVVVEKETNSTSVDAQSAKDGTQISKF